MNTQTGTGTSEVSKKLKAAIRAKLEELGVYVDDELPDYIMVMIANKKEKVQMKDDLNLFIGKSTAKFVDWLFDLFDRLQNASNKQGETSKKEEDKRKELEATAAAKEHEEKRRKEKEEHEKELQKEKEREKERQRERDREKRAEEEKRREEKRKEIQRSKRRRTRSRSNTYSDEEEHVRARGEKHDRHHHKDHRRGRSHERKIITSTIVRQASASPDKKLHSTVTVKRNIRPTGDQNIKGRGTMFLRAMNEASVSAGYGSSSKRSETHHEDDMSDVEALPSKPASTKSPKKSIRDRMSRISKTSEPPIEEDDAVVLEDFAQTGGGPQMILKLSGGREAIKKTRIQDRIVVDDGLRRGLLKRKIETASGASAGAATSEEPKSKHDRIIFDITPSRDSTPTDDSPTMQKWNGQIEIGDDSEESEDDEEAEIDAFVAEARGIARRESFRDEEDELPPTHQLSGGPYAYHHSTAAPTYIPTPLSVLSEQQNQMGGGAAKEDHHVKERCIFWPKCTKGDTCAFMHPTTNCKNFPNCTFGIRCLFIHPPCRFDRFCTKKHCPFTHHGTGGQQPGGAQLTSEFKNPLTSSRMLTVPSPFIAATAAAVEELPKPAARGALGSLAEKLAASIKKKPAPGAESEKKEEKSDENESKAEEPKAEVAPVQPKPLPDIAPLHSMVLCRYAGACRNPICHFKHPKECRFGANCRNPSCYFYHKPAGAAPTPVAAPIAAESAGAAKYKWTSATAN
ncbi:Zinc finger CCCH domain-containing protein 14 [Caenorhabditis elegans]|uniref:Zinc finger CCCH domain-containing protein 14 n=1 Tax=Caenorhabditis elegans TaxID=6239 RepID=ZC3HE_CAEEL|nr:Zinc finger CCCH domain-containing protein 14 [Caenorhabditis elegans]Q95XU6.2 RecName: Full=Zinc finger CCCH domain-containing protein 14; AltName: Full=Suppressor of tau pathology protein 2 [Caenorhabditis elegans]CCD71770.1 Zinc finger CCCH domain-containing protein 14 [Caenorhabditis elegans]|eukprot:NP_504239.2 Zinc finger CCCH domain-containing protein 14 [Caenorhabditis elegans]